MLADCLAHAVEQGAERLVDVATLTGAIVVSLGDTYAGLFSDDDDVGRGGHRGRPRAPASSSGGCRCTPSTRRRSRAATRDIVNAVEDRKAGSIVAAEFLKRFTDDVPWAHVDIAGTAWDTNRAVRAQGRHAASGVRLLRRARAHEPA